MPNWAQTPEEQAAEHARVRPIAVAFNKRAQRARKPLNKWQQLWTNLKHWWYKRRYNNSKGDPRI